MSPHRTMPLPARYDLAGTLGALRGNHGPDPVARLDRAAGELWWACRTPAGPGTLHLCRTGGELHASGYGPGAPWLVEHADAIAGLRDDVAPFEPMAAAHPVLRRAWHARGGLRLVRTGRVFAQAVPAVLGQKVTGREAGAAYAALLRHFGEPAPVPAGGAGPRLLLPPDPAAVAATPYWVFHPFGLEQRRAQALLRVAAVAARLEAAPDAAAATALLTSLPGIGAWTAAEIVRVAYGDPDAVSVGDYHVPNHVVYALTGAVRAGSRESAPGRLAEADARMLALLEPFRGQRGRACQLLMAASPAPPRFGPRMPVRSFARY